MTSQCAFFLMADVCLQSVVPDMSSSQALCKQNEIEVPTIAICNAAGNLVCTMLDGSALPTVRSIEPLFSVPANGKCIYGIDPERNLLISADDNICFASVRMCVPDDGSGGGIALCNAGETEVATIARCISSDSCRRPCLSEDGSGFSGIVKSFEPLLSSPAGECCGYTTGDPSSQLVAESAAQECVVRVRSCIAGGTGGTGGTGGCSGSDGSDTSESR